jgi:hypothetical protein
MGGKRHRVSTDETELEIVRSETLDERLERELQEASESGKFVDLVDNEDDQHEITEFSQAASLKSQLNRHPQVSSEPADSNVMSDFAAAAYASAKLEEFHHKCESARDFGLESSVRQEDMEASVLSKPSGISDLGLSELSDDQKRAVDLALAGETIFFTVVTYHVH